MMKSIRPMLMMALLVPLWVAAQGDDAKRFAEIKARHDAGQEVSQEDRQFAMQYMARQKQNPNQKAGADQAKQWAESHPPRDSTGLVPITDLGKGMYQGEQGGLYPGGVNTPPSAHLKAGLALAREIAPLDGEGRKSAGGKIVLLSIGMSSLSSQ